MTERKTKQREVGVADDTGVAGRHLVKESIYTHGRSGSH